MIRAAVIAAFISLSMLAFGAQNPKGYLVPKDTFVPWQQGSPTMKVSATAGGKTRAVKSSELATVECEGREDCLAVYQSKTAKGVSYYRVMTANRKSVWLSSELFAYKAGGQ